MSRSQTFPRRIVGRTFGFLVVATILGAPLSSDVRQTMMSGRSIAAQNVERWKGGAAKSDSAKAAFQSNSYDKSASLDGKPIPVLSEKVDELDLEPARPITGKTVVGPVDVAPEGWRKTTRGWERAENWPTAIAASNAVRINDSLRFQQHSEEATTGTRVLENCFRVVRGLNPITLVGIQLGLLAFLMVSVTRREAKVLRETVAEGIS